MLNHFCIAARASLSFAFKYIIYELIRYLMWAPHYYPTLTKRSRCPNLINITIMNDALRREACDKGCTDIMYVTKECPKLLNNFSFNIFLKTLYVLSR